MPTPLTPTQTHSYLTHLHLARPLPDPSRPLTLAALTRLQKAHLARIPFENISLHYSPHQRITLHPQALFAKMVGDDNGRGGYCMENNALFGALLRTLGFDVYSAGARVWQGEGEGWTGWSHMVNIVKIGNTRYHVDVAFGGNGPIDPMPLDPAGEPQPHISPAKARLQYKNIPGNTDPGQRLWVYELKMNENSEFQPMYCFTELEFMPSDFNIMNYYTSTSNKTFFTRTLVADKKLMSKDGELVGDLTLNGDVMKWRVKGVKEREIKFESEEERTKALEEHFGITLTEVEKEGIRGLPSEIK